MLVAVLLLGGLWVAAVTLPGRAGGGAARWEEEVLEEGGPKKVAVVTLFGEITADPDTRADGAGAGKVTSQLEQAIEDGDVAAVLLDLDTPGGTVVGSDLILRKVREVRRAGKPVVGLMQEVAASGGYYVAAGADEVVANPSTLTGSIGVILVVPNVERAADKIGIQPVVIKSGPHKDIASPFREMTPEERAILQGVIDEAYAQFVGVVAEGRKLAEPRVRELADGRIYTGAQAKEAGLVDHLGDRDLAFRRATELGRAPGASLVRYVRKPGLLEDVLGLPRRITAGEVLREGLGIDLRPGLKYLWLP